MNGKYYTFLIAILLLEKSVPLKAITFYETESKIDLSLNIELVMHYKNHKP